MHLTDLHRPRAQKAGPPGERPANDAPWAPRGARRLAVAAPFMLPSLIGVVLFLLIPVVIVLVLSFFRWNFEHSHSDGLGAGIGHPASTTPTTSPSTTSRSRPA